MNNDTELFELCKQVYEATGWMPEKDEYLAVFDKGGDKSLWVFDNCCWRTFDDSEEDAGYIPVYTSDYLLEKLQEENLHGVGVQYVHGEMDGSIGYFTAAVFGALEERYTHAKTALKALLKLTIALHKAGVEL